MGKEPDEFYSVKWEKVSLNGNSTINNKASSTSSIPKYLLINSQQPEMIDEPFYSRLNFWHEIKLPRNLSPDQEHIYSHDVTEHKLMRTCNATSNRNDAVLTHKNKTPQT
ncbi:unnamed protein product [Orchesella dallaii]|uniref:Uncharacterized protein n=1 Tax=Orchesella dallaii TaxID=48710 RepID=A0ABP1Q182_9HEXA